jgi:hypothetical protein
MLSINDKKYSIDELKQRGFEHRVNSSGISIRRIGNRNFYKVESQVAKNYISGIPHIQERKQLDSKLQREIKDNFIKFQQNIYSDNKNLNSRIYNIELSNNRIQTNDTKDIVRSVSNRLNHSVRNGFDIKTSVFHVSLTLFGTRSDDTHSTRYKHFKTYRMNQIGRFILELDNYVKSYIDSSGLILCEISNIKIIMIKGPAGGCSSNGLTFRENDLKYEQEASNHNNCFFSLFTAEELKIKNRFGQIARGDRRSYNKIRQKYGLPDDSKIPPEIAIKIVPCSIFVSETNQHYGEGEPFLCLKEDHYFKISKKEIKKCDICITNYYNKHKCNVKKINYVNRKILKNGHRSLICSKPLKQEKNYICHYDIETYQKKIGDSFVHIPYIVGLVYRSRYLTFTGDNCMNEMINFLTGFQEKIILNAFNGSNFDHRFILSTILERKEIPNKHLIKDGSIYSLQYKNISCWDIMKHLQGTLKDNLISFNCNISKGEFNHELATRWEDMKDDLKIKCLEYLKCDVLGLEELYNKLNNSIHQKYGFNITSFLSTSSLTFYLWKMSIKKKYIISLPNLEQEKAFRQSVKGGRVYKNKSYFESKDLEKFKRGELKYNDIEDYLFYGDIVSLYPTAMLEKFPIGFPQETKIFMEGKLGIYNINYITNKNLIHSIGGRKEEGKLIWDLKDGTGYYTSVDIEDMKSCGYQIEILDGWYWNDSDNVFKEYILEKYKDKQESKKDSVEYTLAKLFLNALYGKQIQKPVETKTKIIKDNYEFWSFFNEHDVTSIVEISPGTLYLTGEPRLIDLKEECITKPTQMGAFILAYSRRIMLNVIKQSNPYFGIDDKKQIENDFFYTDTDSLMAHQKNIIRVKGWNGSNLGDFSDDLKGVGKIVKAIFIAPKLYCLEILKPDGTIKHKFASKGLNKSKLTFENFMTMYKGNSLTVSRPFSFKKINHNRNSKQQHLDVFCIEHIKDISRTVNTKPWDGRQFIGNDSVPYYSNLKKYLSP